MELLSDRWKVTDARVAEVREWAGTGETEADIKARLIDMGFPRVNAWDLAALATRPCEYTAPHIIDRVTPTTIVEYGMAGRVPACDSCAAHYAKRPKY